MKIWTIIDPELGDDTGKSAIIVRESYRQKSASASFRAHLEQCMQELGYKSCKLEFYSYILCDADDILCIHHIPDDVWNK